MSGARGSFKGLFRPEQVPEVAAGYFWDPARASGSGAAGFLLPEGNGKVTHNIITPSAGEAPILSSLNGQNIVSYANGSPDKMARTATTVTRGFTGSACFGGWINQATACGVVTDGRGSLIHFGFQFTAGDIRAFVRDTVDLKESRFPLPPGGYAAGPFFYLVGFDAAEAVATNRTKLWIDGAAQVPNVTASPGAVMDDAAAPVAMGAGSNSDNNANQITADWSHGMMYLTSGIPSAENRDRLFNYRRLK